MSSPESPPSPTPEEREAAQHPGVRPPDRRRRVRSFDLELQVYEWGEPDAPVVLLTHGGFDFGRTWDVFAPLLADGGRRVVAWDQRGHGDSDHAALYSWDADVRDLLAVMESTGSEAPIDVIGHSKGGAITTHLVEARPHRVRRFVNIDGIPSFRSPPDIPDHERTKLLAKELAAWLDHRAAAATRVRRPGSLPELAERRGRMNPRLTPEWLRYLVTVGARKDPDGWRWKIDPALRPGGFGPWRATWSMARLASIPVPFLGILGLKPEPMGWGTHPDTVQPYLPSHAEVTAYDEVGHFVHIEQPREVAAQVLDFLS